jgi:hypothetical protein
LSCIDQLGNERRVAKHAPSDLNMSSFKINLVSNAGECNAKLTPPSGETFTLLFLPTLQTEMLTGYK